MELSELRRQNIARCREVYPRVCSMDAGRLGVKMGVQVGDVCRLLKSLRTGEEIDIRELGQHIAETIICADVLCWRFGIVLEDEIVKEFNVNSEKHGSAVRL